MSFFSKLVSPARKGEKNFERARSAEERRDIDKAREYFTIAGKAFDEHLLQRRESQKDIRPSHLVMAGISYTRLGRYEDAIATLDECLGIKEIPDAYLHAGYAAAKLGQLDQAVAYWQQYPNWADQILIANTLKEQIRALQNETTSLQEVCEAIVVAIHDQDKRNLRAKRFKRGEKKVPPHRGY